MRSVDEEQDKLNPKLDYLYKSCHKLTHASQFLACLTVRRVTTNAQCTDLGRSRFSPLLSFQVESPIGTIPTPHLCVSRWRQLVKKPIIFALCGKYSGQTHFLGRNGVCKMMQFWEILSARGDHVHHDAEQLAPMRLILDNKTKLKAVITVRMDG